MQSTDQYLKKTMKNIKINKRTIISAVIMAVLVLGGWFVYHSHEKKKVALVKSYLEDGKQDFDNEDYDKSIADFSKVIEIAPKEPVGYVLRAYSYFLKGEYDKALEDTDTVLKFSKDNSASFYALRADSYRYSQKFEEATTEYAKAYALDANDKDIVNGYVGGLVVLDQNDKAYEVIRKYFDTTPKDEYWDDTEAWYNLAFASYKTHRCMEASTSAWHLLMRTTNDKEKKVGEGIMHNALNDKECIDQDTFVKEDTAK